MERRYAQALGFKIDNPDASRYAVAKHLRETVWPEASQGTVEGAIRTWENAPHWRSYILRAPPDILGVYLRRSHDICRLPARAFL